MLISHLKSDNPSLPEEGRNAAGSKVPFVPRWDESTSTAIITSPPLLFWMVAIQRAPLLSHGIGMPRVRVGHLQNALSTSTMSSAKKGIRRMNSAPPHTLRFTMWLGLPIERHPSEWNQLITDMMEPLLIKTADDTANEEIFEPEKIVNP
ncbi:hypothetical protein PABG_05762 [Paracoccidioides brasiliensis Pb03]|nr:hypothetical protein PABG_05762 [Paracoccidioides brasiliensis Pb03]